MNSNTNQPKADNTEIEVLDDYSLLDTAGLKAWQWELMRRDPAFRRSLDKKTPSSKPE